MQHHAAQNGHVEVVRLLLARKGVEVNKSAAGRVTALYFASQEGHVEVVRLLLARQGIDVNKTAHHGATALIVASQRPFEAFDSALGHGRSEHAALTTKVARGR